MYCLYIAYFYCIMYSQEIFGKLKKNFNLISVPSFTLFVLLFMTNLIQAQDLPFFSPTY